MRESESARFESTLSTKFKRQLFESATEHAVRAAKGKLPAAPDRLSVCL